MQENIGAAKEEEKIQLCNYIDCSILSPRVLMHAVQNPRMPLRFVVQAMFLQQLNTRHSIISAADNHRGRHQKKETSTAAATTLGAILQRDAALRQVSQLKAVMNATNSRIQTLEEELSGMRKLLSEPGGSVKNNWIDSGRSASFRFSSDTGKIERGQIGSISSLSYRDVAGKARAAEASSSSSEGSSEVNFGRRLINGLKSAFRLQKNKSESKGPTEDGEIVGDNDIVILRKNQSFHRRSRSQV